METNSKTAPIVQEKEQNQVSLELMHRMRLTGMAAAFEESLTSTYAEAMTPDAFVSWLLAREWDYRSSAAIERLIRGASFRYNAYPEEIDYTINRGLSQNQMERLLSLDFVRQGQNLFITGSASKGMPIESVSRVLGHISIEFRMSLQRDSQTLIHILIFFKEKNGRIS